MFWDISDTVDPFHLPFHPHPPPSIHSVHPPPPRSSWAFSLHRSFSIIPHPQSWSIGAQFWHWEQRQHTAGGPQQWSPKWNIYTIVRLGNEIYPRKDTMGSFIYAIANDHFLDSVTSSIRKRLNYAHAVYQQQDRKQGIAIPFWM